MLNDALFAKFFKIGLFLSESIDSVVQQLIEFVSQTVLLDRTERSRYHEQSVFVVYCAKGKN